MSISSPSVHLSHEVNRRLGGSVVKGLQCPWPALAAKEPCSEFMFCGVVVLEEGERTDVTFRWKKGVFLERVWNNLETERVF